MATSYHRGELALLAGGARTAAGLTAMASCAAARAGISRLALHPFMVDRSGDPMRVAFDTQLEPDVRLVERLVNLGRSALDEVATQLTGAGGKKSTVQLFVVLPELRPGFDEAKALAVTRALLAHASEHFDIAHSLHLPRGHAGGFVAMTMAHQSKRAPVSLVLGVDSYACQDTLQWLDGSGQLGSETNRGGFPPGEAASCIVLADRSTAASAGRRAASTLAGVGIGQETARLKTDDICRGRGLIAAIKDATAPLDLQREKVGEVYCDINGERYRTDEFVHVPMRLWHPFEDSNRYVAPADCWGDIGAASAGMFTLLADHMFQRGPGEGRLALAWAGSEGGTRGAAVLERGGAR